jgi:uncharacterized membrane protein
LSAASEQIDRIEAEFRARLERHRQRILPLRVLAARPRFFIAVGVGVVAGLAAPAELGVVTRALIGWNLAVLSYLATVLASFRGAGRRRIRHQAQFLDDGRFFVLVLSAVASAAAIGAIVAELGAARELHGLARAAHLALAGGTIVSSWLFIHMVFALHYAHEYYLERQMSGADPQDDGDDPFDFDRDGDVDDDDFAIAAEASDDPRGGLMFPGTKSPGYLDFIYFSYVIGVASQTADVEISSRPMRAVSLAHSVLSFFFNTTILALTINLAAGLF